MFTELGRVEPFQDSQGRGQKCKVAVERFDCSVGLSVGWGTLGATNPGWCSTKLFLQGYLLVPDPPPPLKAMTRPAPSPSFPIPGCFKKFPVFCARQNGTQSLGGLPSDSLSVTLLSALVPFLRITKQLHDAQSKRLHWVLTVTGSLLFLHGVLAPQPLCLSL